MEKCAREEYVYSHWCVSACPLGTYKFKQKCMDECPASLLESDGECVARQKASGATSAWLLVASVILAIGAVLVFTMDLRRQRSQKVQSRVQESHLLTQKSTV